MSDDPHHLESTSAPPADPEWTDPESIARLVARRVSWRGRRAIMWSWYTAAALSAGIGVLALAMAGPDGLGFTLGFLAAAATAWATARVFDGLMQDLERALAGQLFPELGTGALGGLIEALEWPNRRVRSIARARLSDVLSELSERDAEAIPPEQRACLFEHLRLRDAQADPDFATALLRALPALGDERARPHVERLATMPGLTGRLRKVRQAARVCLPRLERRIAHLRGAELAAPAEAAATGRDPLGAGGAQASPVPPHVDAALKRIEGEVGSPPQMRLPYLVATWCVIVPYTALAALALARSGEWLAAVPLAALCGLATQAHRLTLTARHRRIARELAELDDVHAVGRLAEALGWPEPGLRAGAVSALTRLLPRMRASHGALLTPHQRACLYGALTAEMARTHPQFVVALLKAMEQVGDTAAVEPVQQLAKGRYRSARQIRVREAAQECLPHLLAVAQRNRYSQLLLRPASLADDDPQALLRPAAADGIADPALLLRPSAGDRG